MSTFFIEYANMLLFLAISLILPKTWASPVARSYSTLPSVGYTPEESRLLLPKSEQTPYTRTRRCKVYPEDADWPSDAAWAALNRGTGNRLLTHPDPEASVCYPGPLYNESRCAYLTTNWQVSYTHLADPIEMFSNFAQGNTCTPPAFFNSTSCTRGGFPAYVINATEPAHVQAGVNFARNTGIRLVIKNTGHDFLGKSGGKDSLSVWTHHFKGIEYIEEYEDPKTGYKGPAFKCGAGVQAYEIYDAARKLGHTVVGGEGETVGLMGGYIQGGGHSPLGPLYGTGADQVLSIDLVTAQGDFTTANPTSNVDYFWALRGGGGSTFGVATSVTMKAHPDFTTSAALFSFDNLAVGNESFWKAVRAYYDYHIANAAAGTYAYYMIFPYPATGRILFNMVPFFAPNKTASETLSILQPWITDLSNLGLTIDPNITEFPSFHSAWRSSFALEKVGKQNVTTGSRFFPAANFATPGRTDELLSVIRESVEHGRIQVHFNMQAKSDADNAVASFWRESVLFSQHTCRWPTNATVEEQLAIRNEFQTGDMQRWRDISPGSGAYLAESDRLEPNFGLAHWGDKYARLQKLKAELDPLDVFFATTGVGSERLKVETVDGAPTENGKLCWVEDY